VSAACDARGYRWGVYGVHAPLRRAGLLGNKHVPTAYLRASHGQRLALFQGLMDTDGTVSRQGQACFASTLRPLADAALELARTLGLKARLYESRAVLDGVDHGPYWRVSFWAAADLPVFRLVRKADRQQPLRSRRSLVEYVHRVDSIGPIVTRDVRLDDTEGLYLAGRGFVPLGDSRAPATALPAAVRAWAKSHGYRIGETGPIREEIMRAPTGRRPRSSSPTTPPPDEATSPRPITGRRLVVTRHRPDPWLTYPVRPGQEGVCVAPPPRYMQMVEASRDEGQLAVRLYNDPVEPRSFEGFVVHMHLAWLYLLHAEFTRDGIDFRYWRTHGLTRRLDRVDGEPKRWDLARCVQHRWPDDKHPVRANLGFFIGLRNKIEHQYARQQDALTAAVGGQAQALLLNYEGEITDQFGIDFSLATRLCFPVFIGSFTDEGERTLRRLRSQLPAALRTFIADYQSGLDDAVAKDPRYEFRLRVLQELAPKDPDALAVQYTRYDDLTDEQRATIEAIGKKGYVVVRERKRPVVGHGLLKPTKAAKAVEEQIPFIFNTNHFTAAWKALGVRPAVSDPHPEKTDEKYCLYDERHRDYGYTDAYVKKLVRECRTEAGLRKLLGTAPRDKETGDWVGPPPPNATPPWKRTSTQPPDAAPDPE
jgi:hypothetical protein